MPKPETKFWHELKRITPQIRWTRLENTSVFGTPDLLGYNNNQHFFTVELKVTRGNSVRFSPHQIAFHKLHPKNSFILVKSLVARRVKLYEGSRILELDACGLKLEACCLGLAACGLKLSKLGAWSLRLAASNSLYDLSGNFFASSWILVFAIHDSGCVSIPARSAAAALVALVPSRAGLALRWYSTGPRPEGHRSLINHMWAHSNN